MALAVPCRTAHSRDMAIQSTIESAERVLAAAAHVVAGVRPDYDDLVGLIGDRRFVLIGEASHGTHEFYCERARITRRLNDECGFTVVAVEADWPDAYRVKPLSHRFVARRGRRQCDGRLSAVPGVDVAQPGRCGFRRVDARPQ